MTDTVRVPREPTEAVAWRFWHEGGWNFSIADPSPHLADCVERDALYIHPAPIKPSGDTGELRELLTETVDALGQATGLLKACEDDIDIEVVVAIRDGEGRIVRTLATLHSPTIIENGSAVLRKARSALSTKETGQ